MAYMQPIPPIKQQEMFAEFAHHRSFEWESTVLDGYNHFLRSLLSKGIAKYVSPITSVSVMIRLFTGKGMIAKIGLKIRFAAKERIYAAGKVTSAIFHLGGGTMAWMPGIANHVSKPVAFS